MTSEAFAERIIEMQETLYRVSYSILPQPADREDAVQECIRKAWQKRGKLREDRLMQTWVVRILINECYALHRKHRREQLYDQLPERVAPADADGFLHEEVLSLPEELRLPVVLHYMEGYRIEEIARILRVPEGTIKSRLHRARGRLRAAWMSEEVRRA
jgi:RNA polymerase sigma-70 factor (ECF subfamily)